MTRQRQLIYDIVNTSCCHLTAEGVFLLARERMPSIALGTVYRNLQKLSDDGLIRHFEIAGAPDCYDRTIEPHGHTLCVKCGRMEDIPSEAWSPPEEILSCKFLGFEMTVKCICRECGKNIENK